jgi:hypothetical protein
MSSPKTDVPPEGENSEKDRVAAWVGHDIVPDREPPPDPVPARVNAERAISKFQSLVFELTYDQAKEAYMRLLVGRGFPKTGPLPRVLPAQAPPSTKNNTMETPPPETPKDAGASSQGE